MGNQLNINRRPTFNSLCVRPRRQPPRRMGIHLPAWVFAWTFQPLVPPSMRPRCSRQPTCSSPSSSTCTFGSLLGERIVPAVSYVYHTPICRQSPIILCPDHCQDIYPAHDSVSNGGMLYFHHAGETTPARQIHNHAAGFSKNSETCPSAVALLTQDNIPAFQSRPLHLNSRR